ncbi:AMP-binding protein [Actinomadura livida]|uniref:Acyl-CoA synthetase n=1 Tax=Actinomadura livida TaxID=79909 RepID=A0A7W7IFJ2_9ACTN|nr:MULTISPECIES: AMP-binding protein [Actinomadura]MBB4776071.1 long-chain acyl-CoA synthetase [Actinomadura catellatispora]GGU15706.1 long-chain acyl-CoA synthetase [Actinomadura livida]
MNHPWDRPLGVWYLAEHHPDLPAVARCPAGESLTFAELAARAHRRVHALRARGVGRGDVVGMALPNDVDILVWQLAAAEAGWRYVTLNPGSPAAEVASIAEHAGMKALVVHADYAERAGAVTGVPVRVSVGGRIDGFVPQEDALHGHPVTAPPDRAAGAPLVYTSGTTGRPKGIWRDMPDVAPDVMADAMKSFAHAFRFRPLEGAHLVSAGMFHGGCQVFYLSALHVGQPLVIMGAFDAAETLRLIQEHRITTGYMVPTQFARLLRLPEDVKGGFDVSSLESIVHSAAPCPAELKKRMLDWWGPVIWETYGGTEGAATIAKPHHWLAKPGTVGRPIRGMTVKILDDDGNELPPGRVGAVYLDGGGRGFRYHRDPGQTAEVFRGTAFTLGDAGHLDEDGFLFIVDRIKDMIITGGVNVYPAEVEAVLAAHPAVLDSAVVGVPDPEWGEQVRALVQLSPGRAPSAELAAELIAYCRERLAGQKCPRAVEFREELPRTETGKLLKRLLRDELSGRDAG